MARGKKQRRLSLRYSSPSGPAALPVSPRNAHGVGALPVISDDCSGRSPGARMPVRRFLCTI